ncbi:MAG TPA: DUF2914 domain-containing protein [Bacteroidota bacterium]|nr:DUF2914 domain-containing protein [Bacteroidota bacterium]
MKRLVVFIVLFCAATGLFAQEEQTMQKGITIETAKLGTAVQDRELVGDTTSFNLHDRVYLWMKIVGGSSDTITVTWKTGENEFTTKLNVGGSPWRTWAYKTAAIAGDWTVTVTDASGTVLKELIFTVNKAEM